MRADAIKRLNRANEIVTTYAPIVDAKNERARVFCERFGFRPFPETPMYLFLPLDRALARDQKEPRS